MLSKLEALSNISFILSTIDRKSMLTFSDSYRETSSIRITKSGSKDDFDEMDLSGIKHGTWTSFECGLVSSRDSLAASLMRLC